MPTLRWLPIESKMIAAGDSGFATTYSQVQCRVQRLWVSNAEMFSITDISFGNQHFFADVGSIPATIFKAGVWPRDKVDHLSGFVSEFGVDLSTWPAVAPGLVLRIGVRNNGLMATPFLAAFEVFTD